MSEPTLRLGAIHAQTNRFVVPRMADKRDKYQCLECKREVMLCRGSVRAPYFRHLVQTNCLHYDHPGESSIHRSAKMALQHMLQTQRVLTLRRKCAVCHSDLAEYEVPLGPSAEVRTEYPFEHQGGTKVADVACVYPGETRPHCLFEICHTHPTCAENRPEPWFELDAGEVLRVVDAFLSSSESSPSPPPQPQPLVCIRKERCEDCDRAHARDERRKHLSALFAQSPWLSYVDPHISPEQKCIGGCNQTSPSRKLRYEGELRNLCFNCFNHKNRELAHTYQSGSCVRCHNSVLHSELKPDGTCKQCEQCDSECPCCNVPCPSWVLDCNGGQCIPCATVEYAKTGRRSLKK